MRSGLLVLALTTVSAACSESDDAASGETNPGTPAAVTAGVSVASLNAPFAGSANVADDPVSVPPPSPPIENVFEQLRDLDETPIIQHLEGQVADCLAEQGITWQPPTHSPQAVLDQMNQILSAPPTMEEIGQFGYEYRVARVDAADGLEQSVAGTELTGDAVERHYECSQDLAESMGYSEWQSLVIQVTQAEADARAQVRSNPEYLDVQERWKSCVEEQGYTLETLDDYERIFTRNEAGSMIEDVRLMAVADFGCRFELDTFGVEARLLNGYASTWIEENPGIIEQLDSVRARLYDEAAAG